MLAALSFLAGLALAGYGVAEWFRKREDSLLAEVGQHYERRQQLLLGRIDEGDQALLAAFADLDRLEAQKSMADGRLADARAELDAALAAKGGLEQLLERRTAALATADLQLSMLRQAAVEEERRRDERGSPKAEHHGVGSGARVKQSS